MKDVDVKPFLTIQEQISLLKSRGLMIDDDAAASQVLLATNYYRLSAYSLTLRKNDVFYSNVRFSDICALYDFDNEFRQLIFRYTGLVEVALRSYIAYYHARQYGPLGYRDAANFQNPTYHNVFISKTDELLHRSRDPFVLHHKEKLTPIVGEAYCSKIPIWVAIEVTTFDVLSRLFSNLQAIDQSMLSKQHYDTSRTYIGNWLHCAVVARNISAHGGRFYNRPLAIGVKLPDYLGAHIPTKKAFGYVFAIYRLLPFDHMRHAFITDLFSLFAGNPFAKPYHLGFPNNWDTILRASKNRNTFQAFFDR